MNTLEFLGGGGGDESPRWGHSPRKRSGGSGDEGCLPNSFGRELFIKIHFYGGALTSHFTENHSSPISIHVFPVFMMTSSNGNMFRVTGLCAGNSPVTAGNSPVIGEFPSHRPVTRSFDVFFDLRLNKRLSKQSRRRWFETPSHSLWRHCNVVFNSDPVIRAGVGSFSVQRVTLVQFWIGEMGQIWGVPCIIRNGLEFGTLLYPDYFLLKLTIFCTQRQFKFMVSDHP